ncbi:MAG: DUF5658 family protein [Clostridiaceae bacterium]
MKSFFLDYSLVNIKTKLLLLYLLNVTDLIFTLLLLSTGYYFEANILMAEIVNNTAATLLIKIILPAILLAVLYLRIIKATNKQLRIANYAINLVAILYILINIFHFFGIATLPLL